MNPKVRLVLYVLFLGCMAACMVGFLAVYRSAEPPAATPAAAPGTQPATNFVVTTNAAGALVTNVQVTAAEANEEVTQRRSSPRVGRLVAFGVAMFFLLIGISVLLGHDVSRFLASRVDNFIFNDDLEGVKDPDYEEAERVLGTGDALEAVRLMRDYLKKHPREQYVALRIAEIYENQLHNYLAAALEYEEVLKKRLPAERWGWAAIHLANLYSGKLSRTEQATALLRRIVEDYGKTAAARKARERLGIPEPVEVPLPSAELTAVPAPVPASPPPEPPSNLPPGFRPKA